MFDGFQPGALMARSYALPRGPRVCLRLARTRDVQGIARLLTRREVDADTVELARLVRSDPRRWVVICATALVGSAEIVVGIGALEVARPGEIRPALLVVDEELTEGLDELLRAALWARSEAIAASRAA